MKGGDFNISEQQFIPVLFDKYSAVQQGNKLKNNLIDDQCKQTLFLNLLF